MASAAPSASTPPVATGAGADGRGVWIAVAAVLFILVVVSLVLAWKADQRVQSLEQELVQRQMDSAGQATEARVLAKAAEDGMRDMAAKLSVLDGRVAEVAIQRSQLEELLQSLSRSRDENVLVDIEAAIRVAMRQNAITGSAEPLVATLKQSDERLARYNQPRLEGVRRAITRDLDRVKAAAVTDISTLTIRLDDVVRLVDDLPLLSVAEPRRAATRPAAETPAPARPGTAAPAIGTLAWFRDLGLSWDGFWQRVGLEVKSLVRVTRIDHPEAMLLEPENAFFLRENIKLRLLNARLALLSRQFEIAQTDLRSAINSLERYFDKGSRRTQLAIDLLRQVTAQARQVVVPRPDETLAALSAASAGR